MRAPVYRTIDRATRLFGLEIFDAVLWAATFVLLKWTILIGVAVIAIGWITLFLLRFRRPPRFLLSFVRFHVFHRLGGNRYSCCGRERARALGCQS